MLYYCLYFLLNIFFLLIKKIDSVGNIIITIFFMVGRPNIYN